MADAGDPWLRDDDLSDRFALQRVNYPIACEDIEGFTVEDRWASLPRREFLADVNGWYRPTGGISP